MQVNMLIAQNSIIANARITDNMEIAKVKPTDLYAKTVYASGEAQFASKSGYVRILLSDNYGYDMLVYESSPLVATNGIDIFSQKVVESVKIPSNVDLTKVRVEIKNAVLSSLVVSFSDSHPTDLQIKKELSDKIDLINSNLRARNALWRAGETGLSQMTYQERKAFFGGNVPDLDGAEYYIGGIFELNPDAQYNTPTSSNYVEGFDWRNRHGIDWTTPVKYQGTCGGCWAFSAVGSVEGLVNLYYNQKLDLDLSEQQIISCTPPAPFFINPTTNDTSFYSNDCHGGYPEYGLRYIVGNGVVNENCLPYEEVDDNCDNICDNSSESIKIANYEVFYGENGFNTNDVLKSKIIHNGMLAGVVGGWSHAMVMVGYGTVQSGDIVFYPNMSQNATMDDVTIVENDPRIGQTYFIFKNSGTWGPWFNILADMPNSFSTTAIPIGPITSLNYSDADIVCEDRDGDGYYNWGIGPKPATCPYCPDIPDCDDSDPTIGPMDEYGNCMRFADLLIRDDLQDDGTTPNPCQILWNSPDISLVDANGMIINNLRNYNDDNIFVRVKITNRGDLVSTGQEKLHAYWRTSSLNTVWDNSWIVNFSLPQVSYLYGEITPSAGIDIPNIQPHSEITMYVPWTISDYLHLILNNELDLSFQSPGTINWGVAFLARVDDGNETFGVNEHSLPTETFAQNSNNVAVSNGTKLLFKSDFSTAVSLEGKNIPFEISYTQIPNSNYILNDFAELYALLSNDLMEKLDVNSSKDIKVIDQNRVFLTSANSELHFAPLDKEDEKYFIGAEAHFISDKMPELNEFDFDLTYQENGENAESMRFTAVRDENIYFKAHAEVNNPKVVKAKEEVTLTANQIIADAEYIWHDETGNIVGKGYQITLMPDHSQTYKIEIEQKDNGYKSYDEVQVIVVDGVIKSLAPNPANDYVTVSYLLSDNATDAVIQISNIYGNISASYPLAINRTEQQISLSGLMSGTYLVKLLISGTAVDSKNLLKQ